MQQLRLKDGAMLLLGELAPLLIAPILHPAKSNLANGGKVSPPKPALKYAGSLEGILAHHILPELANPHGIMRARACLTIAKFGQLPLSSAEVFAAVFNGVVGCLGDGDLPVRMSAATGLKELCVAR